MDPLRPATAEEEQPTASSSRPSTATNGAPGSRPTSPNGALPKGSGISLSEIALNSQTPLSQQDKVPEMRNWPKGGHGHTGGEKEDAVNMKELHSIHGEGVSFGTGLVCVGCVFSGRPCWLSQPTAPRVGRTAACVVVGSADLSRFDATHAQRLCLSGARFRRSWRVCHRNRATAGPWGPGPCVYLRMAVDTEVYHQSTCMIHTGLVAAWKHGLCSATNLVT
jgi:hypothetical protein